jgi:2-polyprenyl-3-methyl-5-hydroxy-6-metoxy-1,4-benzoquinol methylase
MDLRNSPDYANRGFLNPERSPLKVITNVTKKLSKVLYFFKTGYLPTGERVVPDFPDDNFENHLKVYKFLAQFASEKDVLDVGCGTGYGTAYLAENAKSIVGIDISKQALRWARKHYPVTDFIEMDVQQLRFANNTFDLIVSSENFEHLPNQEKHLDELARVLRPDGLCFVASPNPEMTIGLKNHYHVKENSYDELSALFHARFEDVRIIENSLDPTTPAGLELRKRRWANGRKGDSIPAGIDTTWLNNTHSFFCFATKPRRTA